MSTPPVTRFAPSPTGFLHIGGARTALFNYLFTRHHGGQFRLRIEDTDKARSTQEATDAILDGLSWLGLDWDGDVVHQSTRADRHAEVAHALLAAGHAYRCYATPQELEALRERQRATGQPLHYDRRWRDRPAHEAPANSPFVIRLKAPLEGHTVIEDRVQGAVTVANSTLDDLVLLRADGTPTYMLAVVVDDHDMGVTHVIRGDDHLNNAFRQLPIIRAMGWPEPVYAHIPLIHGADGAKLSKRHGALAVQEYRTFGYLPEALENALLRLSWGHGDAEIISRAQAIDWFDLDGVGRGAARFDLAKLDHLNAHYLRAASKERLTSLVEPQLAAKIARPLTTQERNRLQEGVSFVATRATTVLDLAEGAAIFLDLDTMAWEDAAQATLAPAALTLLRDALSDVDDWTRDSLEITLKTTAKTHDLKLNILLPVLRSALTRRTASPSLYDLLVIFGRQESLDRLDAALGFCSTNPL